MLKKMVLIAAVLMVGAGVLHAKSAPAVPVVFVVQLESDLPHDQVVAIMKERAPEFRALPGLIQKHYLYDPTTKVYSGVYEFRSQQDLESYLASDLRKSLGAAYRVKGAPATRRWELITRLRD